MARPFGARALPSDVQSTRHLTDWGRGDDEQQSMRTQAYDERHRKAHQATTVTHHRAMSGTDMGVVLHDAPPREASCPGSSEKPRPLATPWANEEERAAVPALQQQVLHRVPLSSQLGDILAHTALRANEDEAEFTHPFVASHSGLGQATGGGGGSGGGGGGNGGGGAAAAVDELSETLGKLSVALAERAVGGIPAAQALEGHLRRYDPQRTGTISAADLMRLLKSTSCLAASPSLLRDLPPYMLAPDGGIRCDVLLQLLPLSNCDAAPLASYKNDAPLNFRGQQPPLPASPMRQLSGGGGGGGGGGGSGGGGGGGGGGSGGARPSLTAEPNTPRDDPAREDARLRRQVSTTTHPAFHLKEPRELSCTYSPDFLPPLPPCHPCLPASLPPCLPASPLSPPPPPPHHPHTPTPRCSTRPSRSASPLPRPGPPWTPRAPARSTQPAWRLGCSSWA